jgi:nucleoside-diphosphate-sugar epimerase
MKRVLVTGATGFLGIALVPALTRAGYTVRATLRRPGSFAKPVETVVVPNLAVCPDWTPILKDVDAVVHLAGLAHADLLVGFKDFDQINRAMTEDLSVAAARAGVERFVFISSVRAQTGASSNVVVTETDEPRPTDYYGKSKLDGELAIMQSGLPYTILRPVVVYGPNPKGNIKALLRLAGLPGPLPFGALKNRKSMLAIDNFTDAVLHVLKSPAMTHQTYLLADAEPLSICDILVTLRTALKRRPALLPIPVQFIEAILLTVRRREIWERLGKELVVSTAKIARTQWRPRISTVEGLTAMVEAGRR